MFVHTRIDIARNLNCIEKLLSCQQKFRTHSCKGHFIVCTRCWWNLCEQTAANHASRMQGVFLLCIGVVDQNSQGWIPKHDTFRCPWAYVVIPSIAWLSTNLCKFSRSSYTCGDWGDLSCCNARYPHSSVGVWPQVWLNPHSLCILWQNQHLNHSRCEIHNLLKTPLPIKRDHYMLYE